MKIYKESYKNYLYFAYRLMKPLVDPIKLYSGLTGYPWFIRDMVKFKQLAGSQKVNVKDVYPILEDKISMTPFDAHYFYQQIWVFEHVLKSKPAKHVDVGSTYEMSGYLSKIVPTTFIDLRPIDVHIKNLTSVRGDILNLPYKNNSLESLSSLHVLEHVGLGRYGDPIDPFATKRACLELQRVLRKGGNLYLSTPVGSERVCFNAHRVSNPKSIVSYFDKLNLVSFSYVDDLGKLNENVKLTDCSGMSYGLGMFIFTKK